MKNKNCFYLSDDDLYLYINDSLPESKAEDFRNHLEECLSCFKRCSEMRELIYLKENSPPLPEDLLAKLIKLPNQKRRTSVLDLVISFSDNYIKFSNHSGWEKKSNINLALTVRGDEEVDRREDRVSLTRKIKDYLIDLTILRKEENTFQLMVEVSKNKKKPKDMTVHMFKDEMELEFIDISRQTTFNYVLKNEKYSLVFKKKEENLFEFTLKIESENEGKPQLL